MFVEKSIKEIEDDIAILEYQKILEDKSTNIKLESTTMKA